MNTLNNSRNVSVIDIGEIIDATLPPDNERVVSRLSEELRTALSDNKLVYLINNGISEEEVTIMYSLMKKLFALPEDVKENYRIKDMYDFNGYLPVNAESLHKDKVIDYRESFNMVGIGHNFPNKEVPEFSEYAEKLTEKFLKVTNVLLLLLATGLDLSPDFFLNCHKYVMKDSTKNTSIFRSLFYPPVQEEPHPGISRCSQHTDFGTFTFLMQDSEGGLQVKTGSGDWINAGHIPGAIIINTADLLEIWTSGKYKATVHRVVVPENKQIRTQSRYSLAFFVQPDFATIVKPLYPLPGEEEKKYIAGEYVAGRIKDYSFS